jgi:hypothetical protein
MPGEGTLVNKNPRIVIFLAGSVAGGPLSNAGYGALLCDPSSSWKRNVLAIARYDA